MLSVVIETRNHEDALARTLASLVSGAVEGLVREVIVCDLGSTDQTHRVAEHAGCKFLAQGGIAAGVRQAKAEWLLILEPGARVAEGWMEPVLDHASRATIPARFTRVRQSGFSLFSRFFRGRPLASGLVITRRQAQALVARAATAQALARGVSARPIASELVPAAV